MPKREIIETGKTVDAVIDSACEKLGCAREDCEWEIIDLPKKGFLGLKSTPAKVRVSIEVDEPAKPPVQAIKEKAPERVSPVVKEVKQYIENTPRKKEEEPVVQVEKKQPEAASAQVSVISESDYSEKIELAKSYISSMLKEMGLDATLNVTSEDGGICINIEGKGLGPIIGRRGETLDAIQYLTSLVANRAEGSYVRITVDCGDYRTKRKETLEALAKRLALQVIKTNVSKALEPMNPFERRIIHATVSEIEGVTSLSTGDEPNRRVVITSPTAKPRGGVRRDFQHGDRNDRPVRQGYQQREARETSGDSSEGGEQKDFRRSRDSGGYDDKRPVRRDNNRRDVRDSRDGGRRESRPSQVVKSDGPPKQTPETSTDKPLYTKIDL